MIGKDDTSRTDEERLTALYTQKAQSIEQAGHRKWVQHGSETGCFNYGSILSALESK